ncbi:MAG TPA: lysine--tRNA ligase [Candidatus Bilamarchaeum sp.]|nr:lysine--tRNA ligase [Candidatus Bilamarchaeum sp.]
MSEHKHWSEWLAERVISEKKEPYVITSGITTSGPAHLGTLCEFLFPDSIRKQLEKEGRKVTFFFLADILDAFDSVPLAMEQYSAVLEPHLGKPLCDVPDPTGKAGSFGDHFLDEVRGLMSKFGVKATVVRVSDLYAEGKFDEWARFYLKNEPEARRIVEETSGKQEKKDWSPIMPICEKCGKIATTRVLSQDGENYEYSCDKDVKYTKGCGHRGKGKISGHRYKITWRLHWPAWKQIFHTSIEGAGMDHHTKGGSEDTCHAITRDLMKADYHIPFKYGFILFQGKKYSKSKGIGMGVSDLVKLVPSEIIKYILIKPDLEENVDINPTAESMLKTMEDFQHAAELARKDKETLNRHERKMAIAFELSADRLNWKAPFLDMLLYYQIYRNWEEVARLTGDREGVEYLAPYIMEWIARDFMPEDYRFKYQPVPPTENVKKFVSSLADGMDALALHNAVFDFAKANGIEPKAMFAELYQTLIGKPKGPRLGKLLAALGPARVRKDLGL